MQAAFLMVGMIYLSNNVIKGGVWSANGAAMLQPGATPQVLATDSPSSANGAK